MRNLLTGSFTCHEAQLIFKRDKGRFILTTFLPIILIVVISWLGLWLKPATTAGAICRILIELVAVLMSTVFGKIALYEEAPIAFRSAFEMSVKKSINPH